MTTLPQFGPLPSRRHPRRRSERREKSAFCYARRLRFEPLEDRRLLALIPPNLSSDPGAPIALHIDFDGTPAFQFSSTRIASGPMAGDSDPIPAFSIDADVTDFNQAEMNAMTAIWQHVAEKYSPFNINVTTQAPPSYDNGVAVQMIVGGDNSDWYTGGNTTGVAPLEGFTNDRVNAGFAFSVDMIDAGSVTLSEADRHQFAETIAHEAGHLFGLRHQSNIDAGSNVTVEYANGDAYISPIMGNSGDNYGKRGIWFAGPSSERDPSNNLVYTGIQDDLATLVRPGNFITYRPDDFSGVPTGSGALNVNPQTGAASGAGIIETNGDQDAFSFTAIGPLVQFTVNNAPLGGMLAPTLELATITGAVPGFTVTTTNTSATLTTTGASPGTTYLLVVRPQFDSYGNLGKYSITANVGTFASLTAGELKVTGFPTDNDLFISYHSGSDQITLRDDISGGSAVQLFPRSQVNSIRVELVGGLTTNTIEFSGDLSTLSIPVFLNPGIGINQLILQGTPGADTQRIIDSFHAQNNSTLIDFVNVDSITMLGLAGADTFDVSVVPRPTIPGAFTLSIQGGTTMTS